MEFYIYSSQDMVVGSGSFKELEAGKIFHIDLNDEIMFLLPSKTSGVAMINKETLNNRMHSHIKFHQLSKDSVLCEIKPFIENCMVRYFNIEKATLKIVYVADGVYIFFNEELHGSLHGSFKDVKFDKFEKYNKEYGIMTISQKLIFFNEDKIIYCGDFVDCEKLAECMQIYCHNPNVFKTGQLIKYDFASGQLLYKTVMDCGADYNQAGGGFNVIYFIEAIKCGRFKYAYNKLSYDLKSQISIDTLNQYFKPFDKYIFLNDTQSYITLKNNVISGIYHFEFKDDLINNIY